MCEWRYWSTRSYTVPLHPGPFSPGSSSRFERFGDKKRPVLLPNMESTMLDCPVPSLPLPADLSSLCHCSEKLKNCITFPERATVSMLRWKSRWTGGGFMRTVRKSCAKSCPVSINTHFAAYSDVAGLTAVSWTAWVAIPHPLPLVGSFCCGDDGRPPVGLQHRVEETDRDRASDNLFEHKTNKKIGRRRRDESVEFRMGRALMVTGMLGDEEPVLVVNRCIMTLLGLMKQTA
jgi:hypothetical protein